MSTTSVVEDFVEVGGAKVHLLKGGEGPPLLFLHSIEGNLGWLPWMERIAESATVYAPTHPGFGVSERPELLESVSDMARFYLWFIQEMGLESVSLVGHFLGGWIAAEMATMSPSVLRNLVLVDAAGVRPKNAEIADIFLLGEEETTRRAFHDASSVPGYASLFERDLSPEEREAGNRTCTTEVSSGYCNESTCRHLWSGELMTRSSQWTQDARYMKRFRGRAWRSSESAVTCRTWRSRMSSPGWCWNYWPKAERSQPANQLWTETSVRVETRPRYRRCLLSLAGRAALP